MFLQTVLVLVFLHQATASGSGHHSLWVLSSYISGDTQFPQFSAVLMLDNVQVAYYDSETNRYTRHRGGEDLDLGSEHLVSMQAIFANMKYRLDQAKGYFNLTEGKIHVQQRFTGCEVEDGEPTLFMYRDSCNRKETDSMVCNGTHFSYNSGEFMWGTAHTTILRDLSPTVYMPICVRLLQLLLDQQKKLVTRRVRPRLRLLSRQVVGGARLTCLATDFYPRHIKLTLLRDGRPVDERQLSVGQVLPNGNGLYQVRKTLMIGDQELHRKHSYTCTASHLSLDNRLEVDWRAHFSRPHRVQVLSAPVAMTIAAIAVLLLLWCRRRRSLRGSEADPLRLTGNTGDTDNN